MCSRLIVRSLCFQVVLVAGCASSDRRADFSGIEPFWRIAETYERDDLPSSEQWQELFATPGYATARRHDNADRLLETLLPVALAPSRAAERAELAAAADWRASYVDHYRGAMAQRDELQRFARELQDRDLIAEVLADTAAWLPANTLQWTTPPDISFVILEPDARGYERVVMDLCLALDLGDALGPTLAHESHHVLRNQLSLVDVPEGDFPERDLVASLDNLQAEGVADQIDKADYLGKDDWGSSPLQRILAAMNLRYRKAYAQADETLAAMDRLLAAWLADPSGAAEVGSELRSLLVLGGHPVGFRMANTVLEAFGRERLAANVGDPFAFVADYSDAAAQLGDRHVFSSEALAAVERLADAFRAQAPKVGSTRD
ncbi:MAG: DUF5700 domain-containing putative Zn-dependent protease [Planctomycetota bacterium]